MFKIDLEKKEARAAIIGGVLIGLGLLTVIVYLPMVSHSRKLRSEIQKLERDVRTADSFILSQPQEKILDKLVDQDQIVVIINEITKAAESFEISFVSITPKEIEKKQNFPYSRLPIEIILKSGYRDLGLFLSALKQQNDSIITVKSFDVQRDEEKLPLLTTTLILEVYLKEE